MTASSTGQVAERANQPALKKALLKRNHAPPDDPKALSSTRKWCGFWCGPPPPPPPPPPVGREGENGPPIEDATYGVAPSKMYQNAVSEEMGMAWTDYDANRGSGSICKEEGGSVCGVKGKCIGKVGATESDPSKSCIGAKVLSCRSPSYYAEQKCKALWCNASRSRRSLPSKGTCRSG